MSVQNNGNGHKNEIDPKFFERLNESLSSEDEIFSPLDLTGQDNPDVASTSRKVTKNGDTILQPKQTL